MACPALLMMHSSKAPMPHMFELASNHLSAIPQACWLLNFSVTVRTLWANTIPSTWLMEQWQHGCLTEKYGVATEPLRAETCILVHCVRFVHTYLADVAVAVVVRLRCRGSWCCSRVAQCNDKPHGVATRSSPNAPAVVNTTIVVFWQ